MLASQAGTKTSFYINVLRAKNDIILNYREAYDSCGS